MKSKLIALGILAIATLVGCEEIPQSDNGVVQRFSDIGLNGPMPQAFRDFVNHVDPYGALYVTDTGGGGGRIGGQSTLEAAKSAALAQCVELNPERNCILYATKSP